MALLVKSDISNIRKNKLKNLLMYLNDVDLINLEVIDWKIRFDRKIRFIRCSLVVCYLAINGLLYTGQSRCVKLMEFLDDLRISRLYEKFTIK